MAFFFFFFKQECIVFTFGGKKLCFHFTKSIMTEHRRTAILHIFFLAIFFFFALFFSNRKKKKRARKIRKNPQKCNGMSASKLLWKLKWNNGYSRNTWPFFSTTGIWIGLCENLGSSSQTLGAAWWHLWPAEPLIYCLELRAAGWNVVLFDFPAKVQVVL